MEDLEIRLGGFNLLFGASIKVLGALEAKSGAWRANMEAMGIFPCLFWLGSWTESKLGSNSMA